LEEALINVGVNRREVRLLKSFVVVQEARIAELAAVQEARIAELASGKDKLAAEKDKLAAEKDKLAAEKDKLAAVQEARIAELASDKAKLIAENEKIEAKKNDAEFKLSNELAFFKAQYGPRIIIDLQLRELHRARHVLPHAAKPTSTALYKDFCDMYLLNQTTGELTATAIDSYTSLGGRDMNRKLVAADVKDLFGRLSIAHHVGAAGGVGWLSGGEPLTLGLAASVAVAHALSLGKNKSTPLAITSPLEHINTWGVRTHRYDLETRNSTNWIPLAALPGN
jgi:hypothetical protein